MTDLKTDRPLTFGGERKMEISQHGGGWKGREDVLVFGKAE